MPESGWSVCHAPSNLQYALPEKVARDFNAVVVAEDGERLVIATTDVRAHQSDQEEAASPAPVGSSKRAALATITGRPVRLVPAAPAEIAIALAMTRGWGDTDKLRWDRFSSLARDCGFGYLLDLDQEDQASPMGVGDLPADRACALAARMPRSWGPELLSLVEGIPHLEAGHAPFNPMLCVLVPPHVRKVLDPQLIVPITLAQGNLVVGCMRRPSEETLRDVAAWTGLGVQCVLCEADDLRATAAEFLSLRTTSAKLSRAGRSLERLAHATRHLRVARRSWHNNLAAAEDRHVRAVARQAGLPAEHVGSYLQATAARQETKSRLRPDPAALATIPAALARSLAIVPLHLGQGLLTLGVQRGRPDAACIHAAIAWLTGYDVRLQDLSTAHLQEALQVCCRQHHAPQPAGRRVRKGVSSMGTDARLEAAARPSGGTPPCRLEDLPHIRLEQYAIQPEVIKLIPSNTLRTHCAVPVRRDDQILWVAMAAATERALHDLSRAAGMAIRPLLASEQAIRARLQVCDVSVHALTVYHTHPVLSYLQQHGRLGDADVLRMLDKPGIGVDEALDAAAVLDPDQFAALAAELSGLPQVDLGQVGRFASHRAIAGARTRPARWRDRIDPLVAAEITPEEGCALGLMPLFREPLAEASDDVEASCLVIAVVDPFAPLGAAALSTPNRTALRLVVAARPDIVAAYARIRGRAQLGERLLAGGVITGQELESAMQLHRRSGVRLGQALIHMNMISQVQLAYFLAAQLDLPFVSLQDMAPDAELARCLPEVVERRLGILPLYDTGDALLAAMPDPLNSAAIAEAAALSGRRILPAVCTEEDIEAALEATYRDHYLARSSSELVSRSPEESAARVITRSQVATLLAAAAVGLVLLWRVPLQFGVGMAAACTLLYATFSFYRGYLIYRALSHDFEVPVSPEEIATLDESTLPVYTVLVPLYREASVLPTLIAGLARLDYPAMKLDVKLLLEADDTETLEVVAATNLPPYLHPVIVPTSQPRGKPKACNYGLMHARGEYVVIFDAEDVPEPDQLKKAVLAFRKVPDDVICLQAKLSYYNANQNLLTRWFTIEYSMWFDLFLPGLDASRAPVPLGGTSNHFRTSCLREAGAWDPYNVTEDADLGIRIYRRGWRTAVIESTTYEEATSEVYNWLRQRSRWVKGYIQTYLVHMRHPIALWRAIGGRAFFSFNMVVGGTFFGFLLNPLLWCLTALWYLTHAHLIRDLFPGAVFYLSACSLILGNTTFVYLNVAGCLRPGMYDKVKYALLSPFYWALMSLAAWKGFLQLWSNPFYWEKTMHGQYRSKLAPSSTPPPAAATQRTEVA